MKKHKRHISLRGCLALIFALGFLLSGALLARDLARSARERAVNRALVQRVEQGAAGTQTPAAGAGPAQASQQAGPPERGYLPLVEENSQLAAWLIIPGAEVDYPVMFTPDDPEYYLHRAFDGSYAVSGSLFVGTGCTPGGSGVIVYGHNMADGSMFGQLDRYADEEYARAHGEVTYDLLRADGTYERLTYTVMAAFYSRAYRTDEEGVFRYYRCTDLWEEEAFRRYVEQVRAASLYDLGVTAEYGDRLLILSTCSYHTQQGRFVVVARAEGLQRSAQG